MARKKPRSAPPASQRQTAVATPAIANGLAQPSPRPTLTAGPAVADVSKQPERFFLEVWAVRLSRMLGSLQVAVVLLAVFASCLALGTIVESKYTGKIAQDYVYHTWWFDVLLFLLGINIFFAAAKKWPWKKHQTGFIITHIGLLILVGSGLLTSMWGTDALVALVDTDNTYFQEQGGGPRASSFATDRDTALIRVRKPGAKKEELDAYRFEPGSLTWRADEYTEARTDGLLKVLDGLAHPLPRSWQQDLGGGAELEVLAFYPHARHEKFAPATSDDREVFPALKFQLSSPMAGSLPEQWVAANHQDQSTTAGAGQVQILGKCPKALLDEFRQPPDPTKVGKKGQLVLRLADRVFRVDVDQKFGQDVPLEGTEYKVKVTKYAPDFKQKEDGNVPPTNPVVQFEMKVGDRSASYAAVAKFAGMAVPVGGGDKDIAAALTDDFHIWYHPPDPRFGNDRLRGLLEFVAGPDGKAYYRSYSSAKGGFAFESSGEAIAGEKLDIWSGMKWSAQIIEYLPNAVNRTRYVPMDLRPGLEREGVTQAVRCRLTATGKGSKKESKEFWLPQTTSSLTPVEVAGQQYAVGYNVHLIDLGFQVKLMRAEQTVDPGTNQPASYSSFVQLSDKKNGITDEDRYITMNEPLDYAGYKVYQSGYFFIGPDDNSKPVSRSVFTVGRDPGLWLKYAGSSMLALGITCMFYMKAYFFKPRGKKTTTPPAGIQGGIA